MSGRFHIPRRALLYVSYAGAAAAFMVGCSDARPQTSASEDTRSQSTRPQPQLQASRHRIGELSAATEQTQDALSKAIPSFRVAKTSWPDHVDPGPYESFCMYRGRNLALFLQHAPVSWSVWDLAGHLVDEHGAGIGTTRAALERSLGDLRCDADTPLPDQNACVMGWRPSPFSRWSRLVRCVSRSRDWFYYWFDAPNAEPVRSTMIDGLVKVSAERRVVMVTVRLSPQDSR